MRWLVLFTIALRVFANPFDQVAPSAPDEIASLNADLLVDGFVSAASGQLSLAQRDLHIKGAQDLILQRTYIPPQILGRYDDNNERDQLALGKALSQLYARGWAVLPHLWVGYNQNSPYFQLRDSHGTVLEFQITGNRGCLKTSGYGCSNLRGGEPTSEADIRNIELWVEDSQVKAVWPNGTKRIYQFQFAGLYRLEYEHLPNGKTIRYSYNAQGLAQIAATDGSGKHVYATIDRVGDQHFKGSDEREAQLFYETRTIKGKLKRKRYKEEATFQFPVLTGASSPDYSNSVGYNERTLLTFYDVKSYPISCTYFQEKGSPCRVQSFLTPSGSTTFSYDLPIAGQKGGSTTVTHPSGSQTIYRFNAQFLLSAIENWHEGKLYNQKLFSYDSKQHISKIETQDGQGHMLLTKTYECDQAGNPTSEKWEGDFGLFCIQREFSKNRVTKEVYSDGLGFEYTYLDDTHLLSSKVTLANGQPIRKTQYSYDEACNLIEEREVGKTITTYVLYQEGAHLHRLEWKVEKDWEGNLIHKIHFVYDRFGHLTEEAHYGKDGVFAYRTTKSYDSRDNLLEETNSLGQTASYTYDVRGRQIKEVPFSQNKTIHRSFDGKGNLTTLQEGDHTTRFVYNSSDELIQRTDYLGLETNYRYHPVHGQPIWIEEEPALSEITYDDFGREIARKDAYEATTTTKFNSYGDALAIIRPDGGKEIFSYAPNRTLLSSTDPDGLKTSYTYDPLKRILSKTIGTRKTVYTYDAYNLLEEKDPLGVSTHYEYNPSGQKIKEIRGNRVSRFFYDPLGFLSKTEKGNRWTSYQNDVLGRVLVKSIDGRLDTSYTYDPAGNTASITKQETLRFFYDPYDRLVEKIEADRAKTVISYEEGNRLLTKTIQDPKGAKRIETYSAQGLILKREIPGCTLEEYSYEYDRVGRRISQTNPFFSENLSYDESGNLIRKNAHSYAYDAADQLISSSGEFSLAYDKHYNRTAQNSDQIEIDELNQVEKFAFNANGCLVQEGFMFDEFDQLVQANGETSIYDALGRRIQKGNTFYLYFGDEEVGAFEKGKVKELKIPGSLSPISLEIDNRPYYPIADVQGIIRLLIDPNTSEIHQENTCDPFGVGLNSEIPYSYLGKRYDAETGLVYFGKRYYVPTLGRWLTPDPIGPIDHSNLYQYVFNNPYRFQDPYGENVLGFLCGIGQIVLGGAIMMSGVALEFATFGGYTFALGFHEAAGLGLMASGCAMATYHAQDIKAPNISWKNTNPFDGPVDGEIYVGDAQGNIIQVPEGYQLEGTKNGKWIQVKDKDRAPTGTRKDGGGHPREKDVRGREPHGHVPGVTNPDGTPWLPIYRE